jgi:small subunit ribosomal protein S1
LFERLININNFSWLKRVKRSKDFLKKGDEVEAVVLKINSQIEKILLLLKHAKFDSYKNYKIDALVKAR